MTAKERAEKLAEELVGTNYSVVDLFEAALLASERDGYRKGVEDAAKITAERCGTSTIAVKEIRALAELDRAERGGG